MPKKSSLAPIDQRFDAFQSNEDRKREQRMRYRTEYGGKATKWQKWGVKPPAKGGSGRAFKGGR